MKEMQTVLSELTHSECIESAFLDYARDFVIGRPVKVRRSWAERLFSRPWRPWRKTRIIYR